MLFPRPIPRLAALAPCLLGSSLALGCGGPSAGDITSAEVSITLEGTASAPEVASIGEPGKGLGVSRVVLRASAFKLEPCRAGAVDVVLEPRTYELLDTPAPSETVTTAVQDLCGLRLELEPSEVSEVQAVPDTPALYVEATDASGNEFSLQGVRPTTLHFVTDASSSFGKEPLLLGVDVSTWLADLPAPSAKDFVERFTSQLHDAAGLFVDKNSNGELDENERASRIESEP
jgi:hypothetical protein